MMDEKARGTLIVPYWTSAPFWPVLNPTGKRFASFVKEYKILAERIVVKGKGRNGIFEKRGVKMLAMKIVL